MSAAPQVERDNTRSPVGVYSLIAASVAIYYLQLVGLFGTLEDTFGFTLTAFPSRWWTALTFMFVHGGFWHLVTNIYALYLFGPRLEQAWGTSRFVRFYAFCGVAGLLAHIALVRDGGVLFGASAAVFGTMIAYAVNWPDDEMFVLGVIPMRAWTTLWTMTGLCIGAGVYLSDVGLRFDYLVHLAGGIAGWAFVRTPGAPSLEQLRQRVSSVPDAEDPPRPIPRSQPRARDREDTTDDIVQRSRAMIARQTPAPRVSNARATEPGRDEVNRVLDKISAYGIESLTAEERRVLEDMARHLRGA